MLLLLKKTQVSNKGSKMIQKQYLTLHLLPYTRTFSRYILYKERRIKDQRKHRNFHKKLQHAVPIIDSISGTFCKQSTVTSRSMLYTASQFYFFCRFVLNAGNTLYSILSYCFCSSKFIFFNETGRGISKFVIFVNFGSNISYISNP